MPVVGSVTVTVPSALGSPIVLPSLALATFSLTAAFSVGLNWLAFFAGTLSVGTLGSKSSTYSILNT